jgi:hypothetical protein
MQRFLESQKQMKTPILQNDSLAVHRSLSESLNDSSAKENYNTLIADSIFLKVDFLCANIQTIKHGMSSKLRS